MEPLSNVGFAMSNPRNLFHCVGPLRANPRCFNETWALTRRTRGALRQRGSCTSRPTLRQEHVGPARQDPCFDKSTWVLRVKTHAPLTVHGLELTASTHALRQPGFLQLDPSLTRVNAA